MKRLIKTMGYLTVGALFLAGVVGVGMVPGTAQAEPPGKAKMLLFAYPVANYEETAAFYESILGLEFPAETFAVNKLEIVKGGLSDGDAQVELLQLENWMGIEPGFGNGHIGFLVDNLDLWHMHVMSKGWEPSEIIYPFKDNKNVRIFYFRGPNNEKLELVEIKQ